MVSRRQYVSTILPTRRADVQHARLADNLAHRGAEVNVAVAAPRGCVAPRILQDAYQRRARGTSHDTAARPPRATPRPIDGGIALATVASMRLAGILFACGLVLAGCAATPRPQRRADASGSCQRGDSDACMRAAVELEAKLDVRKPDEQRQMSGVAAYYRKACDGGRPLGCDRLATLTVDGKGVAKDAAAGAALYGRACDGGVAAACLRLGDLVHHGAGVPADEARAVRLYVKGCDGGVVKACYRAGWLIGTGTGVAKDEPRAIALFGRACDGGVAEGCDNAAQLYQGKNDARAVALVQHGCELGDGECCGRLAALVLFGTGVERDEKRAFALAIKACDLGHALSCRNAANMIVASSDADKDLPRAAALFDKACQGGDIPACGSRGAMLLEGIGVARDESGGVALLARACDGGWAEACGSLGFRYRDGQAVPRDLARAVALLERACNATLPPNEKVMVAGRLAADACRAAALLYRQGAEGVEPDPALADELIEKACARGDSASCR
jgi:TPR repeat protein